MKVDDFATVPLCCQRPSIEGCHARQHRIGTKAFWEQYGGVERALSTARQLYEATGNWTKACEIIVRF